MLPLLAVLGAVAAVVDEVVAQPASGWTSRWKAPNLRGSMFEGGADLVVTEGTVNGKQAKWYTLRPPGGSDFRMLWTLPAPVK